MANTLFVCSLPIGNDLDVSQRVLECLKTISFIACEDTRVTQQLLKRLNIFDQQTLFRMDQFQEKRSFGLFARYISEHDVAFVSDAGTPCISDPGALLVDYCIHHNISVEVLPGASAITAFISGAGYQISDFYFGGFMPRKKTEIKASLNHCVSFSVNGIWYESPKRILDTVEIISGYFPDIHLICAKELTKPYETYFRGSAKDVYQLILSADLRGEWIVFVDGGSVDDDHTQQIASIAHQLHAVGLSGQQVKALAPLLNLPKNQLYEAYKVL